MLDWHRGAMAMTPEEIKAEVKATVEAGKTALFLGRKGLGDAGAATVCDLLKDDTTIKEFSLSSASPLPETRAAPP